MSRLKIGYYTLEAISSFVATFFLYYLFFLMRDEHGFTSRGNLCLTALYGLVYVFASWLGGRFTQRIGYFNMLRLNYAGMAVALGLGWVFRSALAQTAALVLWTMALSPIWPTLEALVTEGEDMRGTARKVGIYNVVWSATAALAYFSGGWLFEKLGRNGLYGLPITAFVLQYLFTNWLEKHAHHLPEPARPANAPAASHPEAVAFRQSVPPRRFLQMAWLANPFSYVAINTVLAVVPQLAERFHLSPSQSGVFCSLWFYVRLAAFVVLWKWTGWHYRFRWLLISYVGLTASFAVILLSPNLWWVVLAQVVFGFAVGLTYYSSLFYAMDVGEEKGAHGGLHEAAIGLGVFAGPALGAATLTYLPQHPNSGAVSVSVLLLFGLVGLIWLRLRKK